MRRPVKRARAKRRPSASHPQMPNSNSPLGGEGNAPGTQRGETTDHVNNVELVQRRRWVLNLARRGMSLTLIIDAAAERRPIPLDPSEVRGIYNNYLAEIHAQYAAEIPTARAAQLERLNTDAAKARAGEAVLYKGVPVPGHVKVNVSAIVRIEHEIALILGTHAPKVIAIDTDNTIANTLNRILQDMSPDEYERLADAAAEATDSVRH